MASEETKEALIGCGLVTWLALTFLIAVTALVLSIIAL